MVFMAFPLIRLPLIRGHRSLLVAYVIVKVILTPHSVNIVDIVSEIIMVFPLVSLLFSRDNWLLLKEYGIMRVIYCLDTNIKVRRVRSRFIGQERPNCIINITIVCGIRKKIPSGSLLPIIPPTTCSGLETSL